MVKIKREKDSGYVRTNGLKKVGQTWPEWLMLRGDKRTDNDKRGRRVKKAEQSLSVNSKKRRRYVASL